MTCKSNDSIGETALITKTTLKIDKDLSSNYDFDLHRITFLFDSLETMHRTRS